MLKDQKIRKIKILFIVCSFIRGNYDSSKLSANVVKIFLSELGYCVNIEIPLRLCSAPTFRALKKYERSDVTFSYTHL